MDDVNTDGLYLLIILTATLEHYIIDGSLGTIVL